MIPNISEWPNAAVVCSLSQVLERTSISPKYYLSSKACEGILRRAEKRGKKLPPMLEAALKRVARGSTDVAVGMLGYNAKGDPILGVIGTEPKSTRLSRKAPKAPEALAPATKKSSHSAVAALYPDLADIL